MKKSNKCSLKGCGHAAAPDSPYCLFHEPMEGIPMEKPKEPTERQMVYEAMIIGAWLGKDVNHLVNELWPKKESIPSSHDIPASDGTGYFRRNFTDSRTLPTDAQKITRTGRPDRKYDPLYKEVPPPDFVINNFPSVGVIVEKGVKVTIGSIEGQTVWVFAPDE